MPAQSSCAATGYGAYHLELLIADPVLIPIDEAVAFGAEDVGHLESGPVMACAVCGNGSATQG